MQELIKKTKLPYPQNTMEVKICLIVFSILVCGMVLSILNMSWSHFERSGSLIVIIGIYIAWRDITGNIERYMNKVDDIDKSQIENLRNDQEDATFDIARRKAIEVLSKQSSEMQEYLQLRKTRLRTIEAGVLILGTFVWGYGEVIGGLVYKFA